MTNTVTFEIRSTTKGWRTLEFQVSNEWMSLWKERRPSEFQWTARVDLSSLGDNYDCDLGNCILRGGYVYASHDPDETTEDGKCLLHWRSFDAGETWEEYVRWEPEWWRFCGF